MRNLLLAVLLILSAPLYAAEAGIYYNPEREGEGATVFVDGDQFVMFFYTYTDDISTRPPTVSPYYPPPYVSNQCINNPIWFLAQGEIASDGAYGDFYVGVPDSYPLVTDRSLGAIEKVGTFHAVRDGEGFDLTIFHTDNSQMPDYLSMYSTTYQLWSPLKQVIGSTPQ